MGYYQFLEDAGIHLIDYSGTITQEEGLLRMEQLKKQFDLRAANGSPLKILFDVRNAIWESMQTHDTLAKAARWKFDTEMNIRKYVAVLNNQYSGQTFENEHWFTNKDEAINWLLAQNELEF
jgi:hypothetical protein